MSTWSNHKISPSFEEIRALNKMSLEKMDKILAIVAAMRKDREERERRSKALKQENSRFRKDARRQASQRARRTR